MVQPAGITEMERPSSTLTTRVPLAAAAAASQSWPGGTRPRTERAATGTASTEACSGEVKMCDSVA